MIWTVDPSLRIDRDERTITGGAPLRLLRLTGRGLDVVDAVLDGQDTTTLGSGEKALVSKLADAGMIHPLPEPGASGFGAADVTVVIPVRDDLERLVRLLGALAEASPDLGGVVVVDDASRNPVRPAVTGRRLPFEVRVVRRIKSGGPGAARNTGLEHVTTELVAFIDSDCIPTPGWLGPLVDQLVDENVGVVAPRIVARSDTRTSPRIAAYETSRSPLDLGDDPSLVQPLSRVSYVPTAALLSRTTAIRSVSGFDESMHVGEDVDAIWRLVATGQRVRYEPRSIVQHDTRSTFGRWMTQRFSYGASAAPLATRHGDNVAPAVLSRSSMTIWLAVALGHRRVASVIAVATTVMARRRLDGWPTVDAVKLVSGGHLTAGRQLAESLVRIWWPIALLAALFSRRARKIFVTAVLAVMIGEQPPTVGDAGLVLADDIAYGAGVWMGCIRERSLRALLPRPV